MLLTLTTTHTPATDLGYLLHKKPPLPQSFPLAFGQAHVFYPEASAQRCTAALLLDVDPVGLVRDRRGPAGGPLDQYVNDRPYVASSFLSVAIARVYGSALAGKSKDRPELAAMVLPLQARLAVLPCRGGEGVPGGAGVLPAQAPVPARPGRCRRHERGPPRRGPLFSRKIAIFPLQRGLAGDNVSNRYLIFSRGTFAP